jgi:hypothetical protein
VIKNETHLFSKIETKYAVKIKGRKPFFLFVRLGSKIDIIRQLNIENIKKRGVN